MVHYRISLYAGQSGHNDSTLVEIVKTNKGCGYSFQSERRAIVNAAKGLGSVTAAGAAASKITTMLTMTPDLLDQCTSPKDVEIEDILIRTTDQLHSKHGSALVFALENLHTITTPDKYNVETPAQVSTYIIQNYNHIRDIIAAIFVSRAGNMEYEADEKVCNLSLEILINCMQASSLQKGNDGVASIDDYECGHFIDLMVPSLVSTVAKYHKNAHTACLAMKCLCFMATTSSVARAAIGGTNIWKAVEEAKVYGSMEHLRLEQEAHQTMRTLQSQLIAVA